MKTLSSYLVRIGALLSPLLIVGMAHAQTAATTTPGVPNTGLGAESVWDTAVIVIAAFAIVAAVFYIWQSYYATPGGGIYDR